MFCGLLDGTLPTAAPTVHRRGVVELLVPLATLTGQTNEPGMLGGYGPVIADIARQVAAQAAQHASGYQWRYRVYDSDGTLLHHGTTRTRPTVANQQYCRCRLPTTAGRRHRPRPPSEGEPPPHPSRQADYAGNARPTGTSAPCPSAQADGAAGTGPVGEGTPRRDQGGTPRRDQDAEATTWTDPSRVTGASEATGEATATVTGKATPCPPVQADDTARFPSPALRQVDHRPRQHLPGPGLHRTRPYRRHRPHP